MMNQERGIAASLAAIEARLARIEGKLAALDTVTSAAPAFVGAMTDAVDTAAARLHDRGESPEAAVEEARALIDVLVRPKTLTGLRHAIELSTELPKLVAAVVDTLDTHAAALTAEGVDLDARRNGLTAALVVQAQERTEGFVKIRDGRELYVDYLKPAAGQPVAILLNGLTYRTGCWDAFVKELQGKGLGILRYDPMGHGKTMVKYGYRTAPFDYKDQVADLASLIKVLKIKNPVHLVTLSYGGAIGMQYAVEHPADVATLILMGPFVAPLEGQDQWIKTQIMQTRIMFPLNRSTDDELYDFFLKSIVYATYPSAEPIVLEHPFKLEATFRLVQGVRRFMLSIS